MALSRDLREKVVKAIARGIHVVSPLRGLTSVRRPRSMAKRVETTEGRAMKMAATEIERIEGMPSSSSRRSRPSRT